MVILYVWSCPYDIAGEISLGIVKPMGCGALRSRSHVFQERGKRFSPSLAHTDARTAVCLPAERLRVVARSSTDTSPRDVSRTDDLLPVDDSRVSVFSICVTYLDTVFEIQTA